MKLFGCVIAGLLLLGGCGEGDGGVSGSQPKAILDDVQQQLDAAGAAAEERLEDALERIDPGS